MLGLEAGVNLRVLAWSLSLAVVCGFLVALLPAIQAMRTDPHESLKADARSGGSRGGRHLRHVLVVAELALSVVLLLGAGLLMRSFLNIQRVDRGFDPSGVLTMRLTLPRERYPGDAAGAFFDRLSERLAALPGVRAVSAASQFPPSGIFRHAVPARAGAARRPDAADCPHHDRHAELLRHAAACRCARAGF